MLESKEIIIQPKVELQKADKKLKKANKKKEEKLSKNSISILRTTLRNNVDLTSIADNKANVLLSLNAIMLTFLVPIAVPYIDDIIALGIVYPLIILIATCLTTIYLAVLVLKPGKFSGQGFEDSDTYTMSPFFFGNFGDMSRDQYMQYSSMVLDDENLVKQFLSNDFYYIGLRLLEKMKLIRHAFNIFIVGLAISIIFTVILLLV
ncbi:MAG: hypothetical protein ACI9FN_003007 [Saprospiraceae bacterium]|jgi:hypothetical protein